MTKVDELIQEIEYLIYQEDEYHLNSEGNRLIAELVQAVRDEEQAALKTKRDQICNAVEDCVHCPLADMDWCK